MSARGVIPQPRYPEVKYSITRLGGAVTSGGISYPGGLDLTTPTLALQPGALTACLNHECSQAGGYARIEGYERFNGMFPPSAASFTLVQVVAFTNVPLVGQTITQAVSGATGLIIAVNSTGPQFYMAVTKVTGLFDMVHNITVGVTPIGTATTTLIGLDAKTIAIYTSQAANVYRALINPVPGSGPIRGVLCMSVAGADNVYAFRDNAGGTALAIYRSSNAGWVVVPLNMTVSFTGGNVAIPADGATLTQGGVTALVKRVVWQSGAWTGSATGQFVIAVPVGGNFAAGAATLTGGATVVLSGVQTQISLLPGGKFVFDKDNFAGQASTRRAYGADGVNKAFEFDGDILVPIKTGLIDDRPKFIICHKNFLFVAKDSSLLYSGAGTPFKWSAVDGGGEIATGDTITNLIVLPGSQTTATLCVLQRANTAFLYGTDPTTFNFVEFNTGTGALPYTAQNLADTFVLDDLGAITLKTTLNYGNFLPNTLTKNILPFILQERSRTSYSSVNRAKSQYRIFFSDGFGLWLTSVNQQYLGAGVVNFPNPVNVVAEADLISGGMASYFGSTDNSGHVYQLDVGTSFDGGVIDAYITMAWDALKSPRILKRFRAGSIEMQSNAYALVNFGYLLGYGSVKIGQPTPIGYPSNFSGAPLWDAFTWDNFVWDGQTLIPTEADMVGTAENIQVTLSSSSDYIATYQVNSVIYHYTPRRGLRV